MIDYKKIKEELETCKNPLFFFHDDPDGLCSFLLLYRYLKEGHGIIVKATPNIDEKYLKKVQEYNPDKIFILDIAVVQQEFIDKAKRPIVWIDHHMPLELNNIKYFNPRIKGQNFPCSYLCYNVVKQDLWLAMAGIVGDWFLTLKDKFRKKYPDLLLDFTNPGDALYKSKIGEISRILSFIMKGKTSGIMKCIKILTRIEKPEELLNSTTPRAKFIIKRYQKIKQEYDGLLKEALSKKTTGKVFEFVYTDAQTSFTGDISNELLYRLKNDIIIVTREKSGEMKSSFRSRKNILEAIEKSLVGIDGYGGGHEKAAGTNIKKQDYKRFIENLKKNFRS